MKLQVGYGDEVYGTVQLLSNGQLVFSGPKAEAVRRLLASIRRADGQDTAAFLASLPDRLDGRVWATPVDE